MQNREKLLNGSMDSTEFEKIVRRRLEQNIKSGNFSAISNIPFELSRLAQEIDLIRTQVKSFSDRSNASLA